MNEVTLDRKMCAIFSQKVFRSDLVKTVFPESRCPGKKY